MNALSKYVIIKKNNFETNYGILADLYAPILGCKAFNLYLWILNEHHKQQKLNNLPHYIKNILSFHSLNLNDFISLRKSLEALNLMKTFISGANNNYTCIFELQPPLNFNDFMLNTKFSKLLASKIGLENFEQLNFAYQDFYVDAKANNVSATFEMVYDCEQINQIKTFNYDKLQKSLNLLAHMEITITNDTKNIINSFCENYQLTYEQIETVVMDSIFTNDQLFYVDEDLLRVKLQTLINSYQDRSLIEHLQIFRDRKLFTQTIPEAQKEQIFECYRALNSEQYLSAIVKRPLLTPELGVITLLREEYRLNDSIINLIIDCSLFQTQGHARPKYMVKMADNFNMLNLKQLTEMVEHIKILLTSDPHTKNYKKFPVNRQTTDLFQISEPRENLSNFFKNDKTDDDISDRNNWTAIDPKDLD